MATDLRTAERFAVNQRITLMVNRYEIRELRPDGQTGDLLAFAQQKRLAFKEEVTFYTDEARTQPVFSFKARQRLDLGATYDVMDAAGQPIGWFRKDFGKSILRSSYHLGTPGSPDRFGTERRWYPKIAAARWAGYRRLRRVPELRSPRRRHVTPRRKDGPPCIRDSPNWPGRPPASATSACAGASSR